MLAQTIPKQVLCPTEVLFQIEVWCFFTERARRELDLANAIKLATVINQQELVNVTAFNRGFLSYLDLEAYEWLDFYEAKSRFPSVPCHVTDR